MRLVWSAAALSVLTTACSKDILVGADLASDGGDGGGVTGGDASVDAGEDASLNGGEAGVDTGASGGPSPLDVPWSTGFENGFGDWSQPSDEGFCYVAGAATYAIVTTPVHTGQYAAEFTVNTPASPSQPSQTRCVRQGVLPQLAYYGAWYYVPAPATAHGTWNLFHFPGGDSPDAAAQELWDVSLINEVDGAVAPSVYDFLRARTLAAGPAIPIGTWFHLEVRFNRAATSTGGFTVYLDGNVVLDVSGLVTDSTTWGQWFVGNYATSLLPAPSTVYVDDVTIDATGP